MPPKSKFQTQREAAQPATETPVADLPPASSQDIEALASEHADALEAAGLNAESYGSDDNTGKPDETNPHVDELIYSDEGSQALPDDPAIDANYTPVAPPPTPKGKKAKIVVGDGKNVLPPSASTTTPPPPASKGKTKGKATKTQAADTPKGTVTVERTNLPVAVGNVAKALADDKFFTVTALGLRVDGNPTFEQWATYGQASGVMRNGLDWADYDWARYGEEHFAESYAQWIESTGLSEQTLYNRMSALRKYSVEQRVYGVSITAHVEVASLDPIVRAGLLKEMQDGKIRNISELRERIKAIKKGLDDQKKESADAGNKQDDEDGDDEDAETKDWSMAGEFLYEHVGDGMLEPVLDGGKMPPELVKLIKSKAVKGVIKIAIYIAK